MFDCPRCADAAEEGFRHCPACQADLLTRKRNNRYRAKKERQSYRASFGLSTHRTAQFLLVFIAINYLLVALGTIACVFLVLSLLRGDTPAHWFLWLLLSLVGPLWHYGLVLVGRYVRLQITNHLNEQSDSTEQWTTATRPESVVATD